MKRGGEHIPSFDFPSLVLSLIQDLKVLIVFPNLSLLSLLEPPVLRLCL